jgi:hypothetical protein
MTLPKWAYEVTCLSSFSMTMEQSTYDLFLVISCYSEHNQLASNNCAQTVSWIDKYDR